MTSETPNRLTLTDSEWVQLLDGESDDSQLGKCCANISSLRDWFAQIIRDGRNEPIMDWYLEKLKVRLKWVADGHDLTPLLQKVCDQLQFDPSAVEHEPDKAEEHH